MFFEMNFSILSFTRAVKARICLALRCLLVLGSLASLAAAAAGPASSVLTVNGQAVAASRLEALMAIRTASGQKDDDQTRAQAREELIRHEIVLQTARKSGAETPAVRAQAQYAAENVLVRAYLQQWLRQNPIGKEVIAKEYEAIKARSGTQEVLLRQILLATEDDAKKLLGQLAAGAKFEDLAQLASRDSSSKANGGLLPWMPVGVLPPVIGQEVGKLSKGQMTANAIPSPAGFHVIRLEDSRPFALPPLEQLQPQIVRNLETQALDAHLRQLRDQAQIK
jgi:peptidyl-prolyl cis-trans isomerase C